MILNRELKDKESINDFFKLGLKENKGIDPLFLKDLLNIIDWFKENDKLIYLSHDPNKETSDSIISKQIDHNEGKEQYLGLGYNFSYQTVIFGNINDLKSRLNEENYLIVHSIEILQYNVNNFFAITYGSEANNGNDIKDMLEEILNSHQKNVVHFPCIPCENDSSENKKKDLSHLKEENEDRKNSFQVEFPVQFESLSRAVKSITPIKYEYKPHRVSGEFKCIKMTFSDNLDYSISKKINKLIKLQEKDSFEFMNLNIYSFNSKGSLKEIWNITINNIDSVEFGKFSTNEVEAKNKEIEATFLISDIDIE